MATRFIPTFLGVAAVLGAWCAPSAAQNYPNKIIHIIVPYVAGGLIDSLGRIIAARVSDSVGQPMIVPDLD